MSLVPMAWKQHIAQVNRWRTSLNPLRGLTMQRIVSHLETGERGEYLDLTWLYRFVEKRDATVRALKRLRLSAIGNCEWTAKTVPEEQLPPGATLSMAEEQAAALRAEYERIENLNEAIQHLCLAEFRGYAHLAKVYGGDYIEDGIRRLEPIDQWFFLRDGIYGEWKFNIDLQRTILNADSIDLQHWIVREVEDPIDEIALIAFMRKNMSQKDWDGFIEVFGIPAIFLIMPQGVSPDDEKKYLEVAEGIIGDGRGALPSGSDIKTAGGDVRGIAPFKDHIEYQDSQIVLAGTSGKLTMLNDATGMGSGQSNLHEDVFNALAQAEAAAISELFQRSIDLPFLSRRFPGQPMLAYFDLSQPDSDDVDAVIEHDAKLSASGRRITTGDLEERTGYQLEEHQPSVQGQGYPYPARNKALLPNRSESAAKAEENLLATARKALADAVAHDMEPIAARINQILDDSPDETLQADLKAFFDNEFPALAKAALKDPAAAEAMEGTITAAMINGAIDANAKKGEKA